MENRFLTDWRGMEGMTKPQRQRKAEMASVGMGCKYDPFPFADRTLVGGAPGYLMYDNVAEPGSFFEAVRNVVNEYGADVMYQGRKVPLWVSGDGRQELWPVNMAVPGVAEAFAQLLADWFPWANGFHCDYFTSIGWLLPNGAFTTSFWADWDAGLRMMVARIRKLRPDWVVIGQQYHTTPATSGLNGFYWEEYPTRSGQTFASHDQQAQQMKAENGGLEAVQVVEVRRPDLMTPVQLEQIRSWVESRGYYLSLGRDALAQGKP